MGRPPRCFTHALHDTSSPRRLHAFDTFTLPHVHQLHPHALHVDSASIVQPSTFHATSFTCCPRRTHLVRPSLVSLNFRNPRHISNRPRSHSPEQPHLVTPSRPLNILDQNHIDVSATSSALIRASDAELPISFQRTLHPPRPSHNTVTTWHPALARADKHQRGSNPTRGE
ncbi:hypothetical protein CY34DRAFT_19674 [Suillus luteus UH-Slu-Lm8-n1]|uniref:Uncharacterized protein n=1 Tax=Suillus luteus UH-Slu-Lm8-n1 TaxID=930992 RepID=A0A0C9ZQS7_9AGAM|nr:hypothetical protein CY34DRAFT_19674 [Suillus luteus UH-Slu-Lm8-n1]